jgi:hypothetical protein
MTFAGERPHRHSFVIAAGHLIIWDIGEISDKAFCASMTGLEHGEADQDLSSQ